MTGKLQRLVAKRDLPEFGVKKGDLGGYVESQDQVDDDSWVGQMAFVLEDALVSDESLILGSTIIGQEANIVNSTVAGVDIFGEVLICNSYVSGSGGISGKSIVIDSTVRGNINIFGFTVIDKQSYIYMDRDSYIKDARLESAYIGPDVAIESGKDIIFISDGSLHPQVVLYPTKAGELIVSQAGRIWPLRDLDPEELDVESKKTRWLLELAKNAYLNR